jgi:hypothetical protein
MIKYVVNGEAFATKKALTERIQAILRRGVGPVADADSEFMLALFERHQSSAQKFGAGVLALRVTKAPPYNTLCFEIERVDGSRTDISYRECLNPTTPAQWFRLCCRSAVVDQIQEAKDLVFGKAVCLPCPVTGDAMTRNSCHVDHAEPWPFERIVVEYLATAGIDPSSVSYIDGDGVVSYDFASRDLIDDFAEWHRNRARLRVVSRRANLSMLRRSP